MSAAPHPLARDFLLTQFLQPRQVREFKLPWRLLLNRDPAEVIEELRAEGLLQEQGDALVCSPRGQQQAQEFLRQQSGQRSQAEQSVLEHLRAQQYEPAARAYLHFESAQCFPQDKALNPTAKSLQSLQDDLQELAPEGEEAVREWLWPSEFRSAGADLAIRQVSHRRDVQRFRQEGLKTVHILAVEPENCCALCLSQHESTLPLESVPLLPLAGCEKSPPCLLVCLPAP